MARALVPWLALLALVGLGVEARQRATVEMTADLCWNAETGAMKVRPGANGTACGVGEQPFKNMGANIYDLFWSAWNTNPAQGNLTTSLMALQDAKAYNMTLIRAFAAPFVQIPWLRMTEAERAAHFDAITPIIAEAEALHLHLVPSLGYGCADASKPCNPATLYNETYRAFITDSSSQSQRSIFQYGKDFVTRFRASPAIAFWELGNELNLDMDGCGYCADESCFFNTSEGMTFARAYRDALLSVDDSRSINTGFAAPRSHAYHASLLPQGCLSGTAPALDSLEETGLMLETYSDGFDFVTFHYYGCRSGNSPYAWCNLSAPEPVSRGDVTVFILAAQTAASLHKVTYAGEYGATNSPEATDGYNSTQSQGFEYAEAAMAEIMYSSIAISTIWAFECPSHNDQPNWCLHPGVSSHQNGTHLILTQMQLNNYRLNRNPTAIINTTTNRHYLPLAEPNGPACLDGSPYVFYYRQGDPTKWIFNIQGGGWSMSPYDSYQRSSTFLGSSTFSTPTFDLNVFGPHFFDFSYIFMPYCDGASFTGFRPGPTPVGNLPPLYPYHDPSPANATIYVRGRANLEATVAYVQEHFLQGASVAELMVTGGSAGGLSTVIHTDYIADTLGAKKAVALPNAGFFLNHSVACQQEIGQNCNYTDLIKEMVQFHNSTPGLDASCLAAYGEESAYACAMSPSALPHVQRPAFLEQSKFDHWQLWQEDGVPCVTQQAYTPPWNAVTPTCNASETQMIQAYGKEFMQQFTTALTTPNQAPRAAFLSSCVMHGLDWYLADVDHRNLQTAYTLWYLYHDNANVTMDNNYMWIEDLATPRANSPLACAPFFFTTSDEE